MSEPVNTDHVAAVERYYDTETVPFYQALWDAEDLHLGLFEHGETETHLPLALKRMTDHIVGKLPLGPGAHVVDAGCGVGGAALDIARQFECSVTGLTVSAKQVEIARALARERRLDHLVRFERADCSNRLPFDDASVDAVVSIEAACHFPDRRRFLAECRRILKPGGWLAGSDWAGRDDPDPMQRRFLEDMRRAWVLAPLETLSTYVRLLQESGLVSIEVSDLGAHIDENAHIMSRAWIRLSLEELQGGASRDDVSSWKEQLVSLAVARQTRAFTVLGFRARRPA